MHKNTQFNEIRSIPSIAETLQNEQNLTRRIKVMDTRFCFFCFFIIMKKPPAKTGPAEQIRASMDNSPRRSKHEQEEEEGKEEEAGPEETI